MEASTIWIQTIQLVANLAIVGTFFVYHAQLKTMQNQLRLLSKTTDEQIRAMNAQLEASRNMYCGQNLITLNQVITEPEFRSARRILIGLHGRPLSSWTPEERHSAERACGLWNFVGQLVLELEIPPSVVKSMTYSVVVCHDSAAELLAEVRSTRSREYWTHFSRLARLVGVDV